jgi:hypothetical protein
LEIKTPEKQNEIDPEVNKINTGEYSPVISKE